MHIRQKFLSEVYQNIEKSRKRYGDFKKCEFHIHTPESKCYNLVLGKSEDEHGLYHKMSVDDVLEYAKKCGYINDNRYTIIKNNINYYKSEEYINNLKAPYNDFKEYISYMLIAYKLYEQGIDAAVITDHNTIKGFKKLKYAIKKYYDEEIRTKNKDRGIITLFLGVEISCSDLNHLIVIVDESKYTSLERYLETIIMGDGLGSFVNTSTIIDNVSKFNAITYIAHVQSSKLYGNKVYNQMLFSMKNLNALGLTNKEKQESVIQRIKAYNAEVERFAFINEGDSHSINEIGKKNTWIKFQRINFKSLKKAIRNHQVCICIGEPTKASKYIKGLVVETGDDGFLQSSKISNNENYFNVTFSSDLNCIIGGRGTGKSTILNIIQIIYSKKADDLKTLKFISRHRRFFSVFVINMQEYLIEFIPQVTRNGYNNNITFLRNAYIEENGEYKLSDDWYSLYKVKKDNNGRVDFVDIDKKEIDTLLNKIFKRGYSINKLVEKIENGTVREYIKRIVTYGVDYDKLKNYVNNITSTTDYRYISNLKRVLPSIIEELSNRKVDIESAIRDFNSKNEDTIRLEYRSEDKKDEYLEPFLQIFDSNKTILNTGLKWSDLQRFFIDVCEKIGYLQMLNYLCNEDFRRIESYCQIQNYQSIERTQGSIDNNFEEVNNKNIRQIYKEILRKLRPNTKYSQVSVRRLLEESIVKCFKIMDEISIVFNVNIKEDVTTSGKSFRRIEELSSGQKVVAILTFLFQFGLISNDNTPLVIDQPEDNLDNAYIYNTLVNSLKEIKSNRQVIIVTHSSTIVTNADAEEVIVLESDNKKGWVASVGYPTEEIITKHILNYLEGGIKSFKHKMDVYSISIKSLAQ